MGVIDASKDVSVVKMVESEWLKRLDWTPNSGQDWLMTHADPSIMFSFHFSYTSLGVL